MPSNSYTALSDPARALEADLRRAGVQDVRFDVASRVLYSTDASLYQIEPIGVVIPRSDDEIIATITVCASHGAPVLPRGGGTSLAGQTVGHAVVLDTSRHLNRVLEINAAEQWIRCQPGLVLDHLNAAARPLGLMLGPDPASGSRATDRCDSVCLASRRPSASFPDLAPPEANSARGHTRQAELPALRLR